MIFSHNGYLYRLIERPPGPITEARSPYRDPPPRAFLRDEHGREVELADDALSEVRKGLVELEKRRQTECRRARYRRDLDTLRASLRAPKHEGS